MEFNIPVLMQFAYCVFVAGAVALGALLGLVIFFCLFGYFCMSLRPTRSNAVMIKRHWNGLRRERAKWER